VRGNEFKLTNNRRRGTF